MSFANLNLDPAILSALHKCGYMQPTPIQEQAIPCILAGKDVIAMAQTGTGKTAAFVLPALQHLIRTPQQTTPAILILAPVRELANQITDAIRKYSCHARIKVVSIFGGTSYREQLRQLSQSVDIIVATPGRLIDYLERGTIDLSQIKMFILDEADRMLDMGFIDDVKLIARFLPTKKQTLMFTATMDEPIRKLAQNLLRAPAHITVAGKSITLEQIKQLVYISDDLQHKNQLLENLLVEQNIFKAIIFSATKRHAEHLARQLHAQGHTVSALHGDIKQHKRNRILEQFRRGKINYLVATDVAARGIDISDITHVINFDIPHNPEDYVHRIGRTGRAGKEGIAISLVLTKEYGQLKRIEKFINSGIQQCKITGLEPKSSLPTANQHHNNKKFWRGGGKKHRYHSNNRQDRPWNFSHRKNSNKKKPFGGK